MTPERHSRINGLFAEAIGIAASDRDAFLIDRCGADRELMEDVKSLLRHHNDASLLQSSPDQGAATQNGVQHPSGLTEAMKPSVAEEPLETLDLTSVDLNSADEPRTRSRVVIGDPKSPSDLQTRIDSATAQLMRKRLMVATAVVVAVMIAARVGVWLFGKQADEDISIRIGGLLILAAVYWLLRSKSDFSLRAIRICGAVVTAIPAIEVMIIQVRESHRLAIEGTPEEIPLLTTTTSFAMALLISLYSTFLPAPWRRTAVAAGLMAITPSIVAWCQGHWSAPLQGVDMMPFASFMLIFLVAAVATAGSHYVHRMRLEAEDARSYGQYILGEEIGRGVMGVVYRAVHRLLKRPAAIKLILAESAAKQAAISQFEHEVQICATLTHWNTVQIYDYGTTEAGDFYYVMEYLEGETLHQRLTNKNRLSESETISIASGLCSGLAEAHGKGMVHRDLKPANVFLALVGGQADVIKILDFGLAVNVAQTDSVGGAVCGTPGFMSPEQIRGESVDGRSDLYAIGCILFECLTGHRVFMGATLSAGLNDHLFKTPPREELERVAPNLAGPILRCLEKQREKRFADATELGEVIRNIK
ncbi:MAG: serine/threonine-protein kinase [Planctomycetota bacterium]